MNKKDLLKDYGRQIGMMLLVALVTIGIIFVFHYLGTSDESLPENFPQVYEKAQTQNQEIVQLANSVNKKIEEINEMDLEGNSEESLELINEASEENQKAREKALELSETLDNLNSMLGKSGGAEKIQVAREALEIEGELVSEFLSYTKSLENFLAAVEEAVKSDSFSDRVSVEQRLEKVNEKKNKINSLNQELVSKIREFSNTATN